MFPFLSWISPRLPALLVLLTLLSTSCARRNYFQPDARVGPTATAPLPAGADSVRATAGRHYNHHSAVHKLLYGRHYRPVWAAEVKAPVLNLSTAAPGGLKAGKMGGGFQSISMTLENPTGREYALRALDKAPNKTLPIWLRKTFLLNVVRDATSAANPYGALTVPPLAQATGVPHSHPRLVYVRPDANDLGEGSERFRGKLALLEEKYDGPADRTGPWLSAETFRESEEMLKKLYASHAAFIEQPAFLRARLLDVWLGDWDRHEGQWQWAEFAQKNGRTRFQAIPKDRDQVYFRFDDGLIPWLVSRFVAPRFQTFKPTYTNVHGLVSQGHFLDQRSLSLLRRADFHRMATELQRRLPDTLLERAARLLPSSVYALEGKRLVATLQARREALPQAADAFYLDLFRQAVVGGTSQPERFVVRRYADSTVVRIEGGLQVSGQGQNARVAFPVFYQRTFLRQETKHLTLEALGGDDELDVRTINTKRPMPLAIHGGPGTDELTLSGSTRHLRYYDEAGSKSPIKARPTPKKHKPYARFDKDKSP
ncbi:hypothetical protein GCM10023185_23840 [Hymenobacter saemangeumensis]|uniref:GWxTD domain-containing protein n=1 Tax=Hymenobacter saemangeumensis TaxID=1084522 RepID=A0ABP8IG96_9BACT